MLYDPFYDYPADPGGVGNSNNNFSAGQNVDSENDHSDFAFDSSKRQLQARNKKIYVNRNFTGTLTLPQPYPGSANGFDGWAKLEPVHLPAVEEPQLTSLPASFTPSVSIDSAVAEAVADVFTPSGYDNNFAASLDASLGATLSNKGFLHEHPGSSYNKVNLGVEQPQLPSSLPYMIPVTDIYGITTYNSETDLYTPNDVANQEALVTSSKGQELSHSSPNDVYQHPSISSALASSIISRNIKITDIHDLYDGGHAAVDCPEPSQAVIHHPIPLKPHNYFEPLQNPTLRARTEPYNHPHPQVNQESPCSQLYPRLEPQLSALPTGEAEIKQKQMSDLAPEPVPQCPALSTSPMSGSLIPVILQARDPSSANGNLNLLAALQVQEQQRQMEHGGNINRADRFLVPGLVQADALFSSASASSSSSFRPSEGYRTIINHQSQD
ncbi:hypothetical protein CPB84DRAFT_1749000 [Gymnopilus junonius]|uniref:Uncharacterized protein n=1 Tax=Gymnopilus junonius TaxID=109634 RepID=A0A9P5TKZ9_GYMJU|nr:hypothetical protein CPB84DRAFT_1749000 [Gymnopilus junonius]